MSKHKKKKNRKSISPEAVANLKTGFATLISNDAVIKASREFKGPSDLLPIGLALVAVVLAVLPRFVYRMNISAASTIFASTTANYEQGLSNFLETLVYDPATGAEREEKLQLSIDASGTFSMTKEHREALTGGEGKWYTVTRRQDIVDVPVFEVFFNYDTTTPDSTFYNCIDTNQNPYTQTARGEATEFQASYLAFGKNSIRFRRRNAAVASYIVEGDYKAIAGANLTQKALEIRHTTTEGLRASSLEFNKLTREYFSQLINDGTNDAKIKGTWQETGIFAAIDLGLIVLFGLVLFIMTRGKKNPFRIYKFWETQKMAYWAAFTPSVLALILGFWLVQYAFIFFMFGYGMRMMWMSMKSLRPVQ